MKIIKITALVGIFSLLLILTITSCKKTKTDVESAKTPGSKTSAQQSFPSPFSGKYSPPITKYFVNHIANVPANSDTDPVDPNPIDCTTQAFTDIYALKAACDGGATYSMDFIKIETNWASTSPYLVVAVNGTTLSHTATYMGGEATNHCLAYYQLLNVPAWELGVFDFCTPQTLNITYTDPVIGGIVATETIVVSMTGCSSGSYTTQAWLSGSNEISMALPFNYCICPGSSVIWPPSYTFRLIGPYPSTTTTDITVPYATYPGGYFYPTVFTGLASGTYLVRGKNNCPGVTTEFVPGEFPSIAVP